MTAPAPSMSSRAGRRLPSGQRSPAAITTAGRPGVPNPLSCSQPGVAVKFRSEAAITAASPAAAAIAEPFGEGKTSRGVKGACRSARWINATWPETEVPCSVFADSGVGRGQLGGRAGETASSEHNSAHPAHRRRGSLAIPSPNLGCPRGARDMSGCGEVLGSRGVDEDRRRRVLRVGVRAARVGLAVAFCRAMASTARCGHGAAAEIGRRVFSPRRDHRDHGRVAGRCCGEGPRHTGPGVARLGCSMAFTAFGRRTYAASRWCVWVKKRPMDRLDDIASTEAGCGVACGG